MNAPRPRLFIGSSSEGRDVARSLQAELGNSCEVVRWDQSVFEPGGYTLDSLISTAQVVDFAVLVATPDDKTVSRGEETASARDNVVLEFGLFAGAIGRERTYLLSTGELKLPTDVLGLTRLPYHPQPNRLAAVTAAALQVEERVRSLGKLHRSTMVGGAAVAPSGLDRELELLCAGAVAQGWTVKKNDATTLRLVPPGKGRVPLTMTKKTPDTTRDELRHFVRQLRAAGLRVNNALRLPVDESPL